MDHKVSLGQFFTKNDYWLFDKPQIIEFIEKNIINKKILLDPFYGEGDLFKTLKKFIPHTKKIMGFDIDNRFINNKDVFYNDSLKSIINKKIYNINDAFLITNPPYLAKVSAKRQKVNKKILEYYETEELNDLYKIALKKMFESKIPGIAIIPESFINSKFFANNHELIDFVTTIIPNPFNDTDLPVCVIGFNGIENKTKNTIFYINNEEIYSYNKFLKYKNNIKTNKQIKIIFNDTNGQIGLKGIDSSSEMSISFINASEFNYSKSKIKVSSRVMSYLYIDENILEAIDINRIIEEANKFLNNFRSETRDLIFTPFKGNIINLNIRRRRIDYKTARWILEKTIEGILNYES